MALIHGASHGRVVGSGVHDQRTDQALEHIGLLQSVADGLRIGGAGAVDGIHQPHHTVMTEQALALHSDVVGLGDLLAEGLGLGSAEADTGDIQAVLQSTPIVNAAIALTIEGNLPGRCSGGPSTLREALPAP